MTSAALKKALITLFGGRGNIPKPDQIDSVAEQLYERIRDTVGDDDGGDSITQKDLFSFLVLNSESGISKKTVASLFSKVDLNGDGNLSHDEFMQVIHRCYKLLQEQLSWDDSATKRVPSVYVVPGSSAHNSRSGTQAFRVAVVRRPSMKRLWQLYRELDADNDGHISMPEFKKYVKRKQAHVSGMAASIFSSLDRNKDGLISFKELLQNLFPAASRTDIQILMRMAKPEDYEPSQGLADAELLQDVRNIFAIFDDDHSGSLDLEEFTHALQLLGFDEKESTDIFNEIDKDGSGEVSIQEFELWYDSGQANLAKKLAQAELDSDADEP